MSTGYFDQMRSARIVVTVNPPNWEGDFRLWETLATGALVLVDPIYVPHPHELVDGEHVVYFSNTNQSDLFAKLDYYRAHPREAQRIATNGYFHAMKFHRTVSCMDYVLRSALDLRHALSSSQRRHSRGVKTVEEAEAEAAATSPLGYSETALMLRQIAITRSTGMEKQRRVMLRNRMRLPDADVSVTDQIDEYK